MKAKDCTAFKPELTTENTYKVLKAHFDAKKG